MENGALATLDLKRVNYFLLNVWRLFWGGQADELSPTELADAVLRARHVLDVLKGLGLWGPDMLDHPEQRICTFGDPSEELTELLKTACLRDWGGRISRLFDSEAKLRAHSAGLSAVLTAVVKAAGLKLVRSTDKTRITPGKKGVRGKLFTYQLEAESASKMRELVALREGCVEKVEKWKHLL